MTVRHRLQRRRVRRAWKVDVGRRDDDVLARVEAADVRALAAPEEPTIGGLAMRADDVVVEKVGVLVLAVEAARA